MAVAQLLLSMEPKYICHNQCTMDTSSPIVPKLSTEILLIPAILELYHKPPLKLTFCKMDGFKDWKSYVYVRLLGTIHCIFKVCNESLNFIATSLFQAGRNVRDLFEDLRDGHNLLSLLEVLSGEILVCVSIFLLNHYHTVAKY